MTKLFPILITILIFSSLCVEAIPSLRAPAENVTQTETVSTSIGPLKQFKKTLVKWQIYANKKINTQMNILKKDKSWLVIGTSLLLSFIYGIVHTLGPGHGKMVVATYFLTRKASYLRGCMVGLQVATSHVLSAVFIVFIADITLRNVILNPEAQLYGLKLFSYGAIALIGGYMLIQAINHLFSSGHTHHHSCSHCAHHHHEHKKDSWISFSIGIVPCTGSMLILLYSLAHNMVWTGILMVSFIAIGMAITMIIIGFVCVLGKKHVIDRFDHKFEGTHNISIAAEILGALVILTIGLLLIWSLH